MWRSAGVSRILLARVLEWDDLLAERRAWDALVWFAGLVMMSDMLVSGGAIGVLSDPLVPRAHRMAVAGRACRASRSRIYISTTASPA